MKRIGLWTVAALLAAVMAALGVGYAQAPTLTSHAPITISGNAAFTAANGVVSGSGIPADPYIIENWDINATGSRNGIYIENTDAYFIIRKCSVYNADEDGVHFFNVKNGVITASTVYANNVVVGPWRQVEVGKEKQACCGGIWADKSAKNEISKNEVVDNHGIGICLTESTDHGVLANGVARNEGHGIWLWKSDTNRVAENTVANNNGHGLLLLESDLGQVIGNTVTANGVGGTWASGVALSRSSLNEISANSVTANARHGIFVVESNGNQVIQNTVLNNTLNGIGLTSSANNNLVSENTSQGNGSMGVDIYGSANNNQVSKNVIKANQNAGIALRESANNNDVSANTVEANTQYGIVLWGDGPSGNLIYHNNLLNNGTNGYDSGTNQWDNGYPAGGNYWSDLRQGSDYFSGPNQNQSGSDGKCDSAYRILGGNNRDRYPLMQPYAGP